ncbi:NINE protein [Arthrobacter sp. I2-34]|uniref:NINE protein n=1 Tax=Arthrobacter hankyongi TaxID=2904801 RepID=A0ABS9L360_9MICC|nr:TM2 domain-containing protein [Arthrobacter hankyongi]MCG2621051.1 NINE protein [Arthrobacter hankyongi]
MSENPDASDARQERPANPTEPVPPQAANPTLPLSKPEAGGAAGTDRPPVLPAGPQSPGAQQQPPYAQPYGQQDAYGAQNPYAPPAGPQDGPYAQPYPQQPYSQQPYYGIPGQPYNVTGYVEQKSRLVGGLLGILLGGLGIHRFYLGYTAIGVLQIVVTFLTFGFGAIWGFIEGIMILVGAEPFRRDARGVPLKE